MGGVGRGVRQEQCTVSKSKNRPADEVLCCCKWTVLIRFNTSRGRGRREKEGDKKGQRNMRGGDMGWWSGDVLIDDREDTICSTREEEILKMNASQNLQQPLRKATDGSLIANSLHHFPFLHVSLETFDTLTFCFQLPSSLHSPPSPSVLSVCPTTYGL